MSSPRHAGRLCGPAALFVALAVSACATTPRTTRSAVLQAHPAILQLDTGLIEARAAHAHLLAPEHLRETEAKLQTAVDLGRAGRHDEAKLVAKEGLAQLAVLDQLTAANHENLREVMAMRSRAARQGASSLFEKDFLAIDEKVAKTGVMLERQETDKASERRPMLIEAYAALELRALQQGLPAAAQNALEKAKEAGAEDHAPRTFTKAQQELELARSLMEADRTQLERSDGHSRESMWLAQRAIHLTRQVRRFEEADATAEDMLLWHQAELQKSRASPVRLPFDQAEPEVIRALVDDRQDMRQTTQDLRRANRLAQDRLDATALRAERASSAHRAELQTLLTSHERELATLRGGSRAEIAQAEQEATQRVKELQTRLSAETKAREDALRLEREAKARYDHVRALFAPKDADVYRQGDDVLIRLRGFTFESGVAEIRSGNYALLSNLVTALGIFPGSKVVVSGHTDSRGRPEANLQLSVDRANSVATFLTTVGGIASLRIQPEGHGADRPIDTNETTQGRAANRRIDVLIVNRRQDPTQARGGD